MTHVQLLHGQRGHKSSDYTQSEVPNVGGKRAWSIDTRSNKDVCRRESKTPTQDKHKDQDTTEKVRSRQSNNNTTNHDFVNMQLTMSSTPQDKAGTRQNTHFMFHMLRVTKRHIQTQTTRQKRQDKSRLVERTKSSTPTKFVTTSKNVKLIFSVMKNQ